MGELNKLDIKLGEWASVIHFNLRFTSDLNACFEWLVPKSRVETVKFVPMSDGGYGCVIIPFGWVDGMSFIAKTPAEALCRVIEKLIDGEKDAILT